jgi:hypothetical protein
MNHWARVVSLMLLGAAISAYAADWLIFSVRGSRTSTVTVYHFLSAPLKNNKEERDYLGSEDVPCSLSLFPQAGHLPCWYLRRHKNQVTNI